MKSPRKIEAMHERFGVVYGKSYNDCSNLWRGRYRTRTLCKCEVYGMTHSEATDWSGRNVACGMLNQTWDSPRGIIELLDRSKTPDGPMDGQIEMEV